MNLRQLAVLLAVGAAVALPAGANDSAASTAAGGIQLKREARISMNKERLSIGVQKVVVEYEFGNETDQDIETDVAFPIPPYKYDFEDPVGGRGFDDFKLWVDGKPVKYNVEIHATVDGKDYTDLLKTMGVDINSFGHISDKSGEPISTDVHKLPAKQRKQLRDLGLIEKDYDYPTWTNVKTYYWHQVFPAKSVLRVKHQYNPVTGFTQIHADELDSAKRAAELAEAESKSKPGDHYWVDELKGNFKRIEDACMDAALVKRLQVPQKSEGWGDMTSMLWVDYILTTANSWKMPIHDFELIVEKPAPRDAGFSSYVSFCWDAPLEKIDAKHFRSHVTDFVPKKELQVTFLEH